MHLTLKNTAVPVATNPARYAGPRAAPRPAGVPRFKTDAGLDRLQINAQNCVHCKTQTSRTRRRTSSGSRLRVAARTTRGQTGQRPSRRCIHAAHALLAPGLKPSWRPESHPLAGRAVLAELELASQRVTQTGRRWRPAVCADSPRQATPLRHVAGFHLADQALEQRVLSGRAVHESRPGPSSARPGSSRSGHCAHGRSDSGSRRRRAHWKAVSSSAPSVASSHRICGLCAPSGPPAPGPRRRCATIGIRWPAGRARASSRSAARQRVLGHQLQRGGQGRVREVLERVHAATPSSRRFAALPCPVPAPSHLPCIPCNRTAPPLRRWPSSGPPR